MKKALIILLVLLSWTTLVILNASAQSRPNIVFVLADDLGYSDVGFNGQRFYETPNIDALARDGMILSDFYSGGPNCAPTRACINTGMYTPRHKLFTPDGQAKGNLKSMRFAVPSSVIRKGDYKLIYYYEYDNYKLFNLREDISEENDLAMKMPEKAEKLKTELMTWVKDTNAPVPSIPNPNFNP